MHESQSHHAEALVLLLTRYQGSLFRYIFSLVPREPDARDVLQETCLALYRKREQYDATRPFLPWAYRFAYLQVQKHREKATRSPLLFSADVVTLLADERPQLEGDLDERLRLLDDCLRKLSARDKELVVCRYVQRDSADAMMTRFRMSRRTLFRTLEVLRVRLHACVTLHLQVSGQT